MDYAQTVSWMFDRLPMFQRQGSSAFRKDLTNIRILCDYLGNPQNHLNCIHVAGTNGKGSTSHMLASVLQESGYKTGLFTSPHLKDFRERIRINGQMIPKESVVEFVALHRGFFESHDMSFFEMTTGLAFEHFKQLGTDICVIETGMGGRLDATNVIVPMLSVITNIGMDHTQYLGTTPGQIAREKAGIIKPGVPVVIGQATHATRKVFLEIANNFDSPVYFAGDLQISLPESDLKGDYQRHNIKTALTAIEVLNSELAISNDAVRNGLANVVAKTGLRGRWEILGHEPLIIADTAHNIDGLREVLAQMQRIEFGRLHFILGMVNDKDLTPILEILPKRAQYYFCKPDLPRGLDANSLQQYAGECGLSGKVYGSVAEAYRTARNNARPEDLIYAGGSTFVVAEIL